MKREGKRGNERRREEGGREEEGESGVEERQRTLIMASLAGCKSAKEK